MQCHLYWGPAASGKTKRALRQACASCKSHGLRALVVCATQRQSTRAGALLREFVEPSAVVECGPQHTVQQLSLIHI